MDVLPSWSGLDAALLFADFCDRDCCVSNWFGQIAQQIFDILCANF